MKHIKLILLACITLNAASQAENFHPISSQLGIESMYTKQVIGLLDNWAEAKKFCTVKGREIITEPMRTPKRPYYVGFKKCAIIDAPLKNAAAVIDDWKNYINLFQGFAKIKKVSEDGNRLILSWEKTIPVFFVPNVIYQIGYLTDKTNPNRVVYRYQVVGGERLTANDGLEVFEKISENKTLFVNYEYYEANYDTGLLGIKAVSSEQVWRESLIGSYKSVFAIRFKAEHPEWTYDKVKDESDDAVAKLPKNAFGDFALNSDGPITTIKDEKALEADRKKRLKDTSLF